MEKWRRVWREGLAPHISRAGLLALKDAVIQDAESLLQGTTCYPPKIDVNDSDVEGACALGFCGWQGDGIEQVGELEEYFQTICTAADNACHEPAACRYFLNWYDDTPRENMRRELLPEIELALQTKGEHHGWSNEVKERPNAGPA